MVLLNEWMEVTRLLTDSISVVCGGGGTETQKPSSTVLWSAFKSRGSDFCPRERPASRQPQGSPRFFPLCVSVDIIETVLQRSSVFIMVFEQVRSNACRELRILLGNLLIHRLLFVANRSALPPGGRVSAVLGFALRPAALPGW